MRVIFSLLLILSTNSAQAQFNALACGLFLGLNPSMSVPIISMPITPQSQVDTCGAASLDSVLKSWGIASPGEMVLAEQLGIKNGIGAFPEAILRVAALYKLNGKIQEGTSIDQLRNYLKNGETILVAWT